MLKVRIVRTACSAVVVVAVTVGGCGADRNVDSRTTSALAIQSLPDPVVWRVKPATLDALAQNRKAEVDRLLVAQRAGQRIVTTIQTYSGDIYDWVDADTVPGSHATPPPAPAPEKRAPLTELEAYPELRGPSGTIPILRPTFSPYVRGESSAPSLNQYILDLPPGQPAGQFRQWAGYIIPNTQNHGASSGINAYPGGAETGTFTLLEQAIDCVGTDEATTKEIVGAVLARGAAGFDGTALRFDTEFWTAGLASGNNIGGWNTSVTGWVPYAGAPYGPGVQLSPVSVSGGAQYEVGNVTVQKNAAGWWIAFGGNWLGYYPSSLFDLINNAGCAIHWYGEVFDPTPTSWTTNDMGEGGFASQGFGYASYFDRVYFLSTNDNWYLAGAGNAAMITNNDPLCYSTSAWNAGPQLSNYPNWFYLGGPGHTATNGCN